MKLVVESSTHCGITYPDQIELQMLISSWELLNKGEGLNLELSKHGLGIQIFQICRDLNPHQSVSDDKCLDTFDYLGTLFIAVG